MDEFYETAYLLVSGIQQIIMRQFEHDVFLSSISHVARSHSNIRTMFRAGAQVVLKSRILAARNCFIRGIEHRAADFFFKRTDFLRRSMPCSFVVGAKGVGKSYLLQRLYEQQETTEVRDTLVKHYVSPDMIPSEDVDILLRRYLNKERTTLLLDNIQRLPSAESHQYRVLHHIFKEIRKGDGSDWLIVAAASRHGLKKLFNNNFVSSESLVQNMFILSPDKVVTKEEFEKELKKLKFAFLEEEKKEVLEYLGYNMKDVQEFVTYVEKYQNTGMSFTDLFEDFKTTKKSSMIEYLRSDYRDYETPQEQSIYRKVLAHLASGLGIESKKMPIFLPKIPWTLLKEEVCDGKRFIKAMSPLAREASLAFVSNDPSTILEMMREVHNLPIPSQAVVGNLFELLCEAEFPTIRELEYSVYDKQSSKLIVESLKVPLFPLGVESVKGRSYPDQISEEPRMFMGKMATGWDIVMQIDGESHAIQLSMGAPERKIMSEFFVKGNFDYRYFLNPGIDKEKIQQLIKENPTYKKAFEDFKLRLIRIESIFDSEAVKVLKDRIY